MKRRIVLLGPPASGKGSQSHLIFQKYQIPAVSTGHLLRDEAVAQSELGQLAASYTSKGQLAPDELVMAVLRKWLGNGRNSFVFDGFPRTLEQALHLQPLLEAGKIPLEIVLFLDCELSTIEERVLGRLTCSLCKSIFHSGIHVESVISPCPKCGGKLFRRADDEPSVLKHRMTQYFAKTSPLVEFYEGKGLLTRIDANRMESEVFADIEEALLQ